MVTKPVSKRFAALAVAAIAAGVVTACTSSSGSTASNGGTPVSGGTLNFVAAGDVDHLDTLSAYYLPTFQLEVAFTRQLVSYWPSNHRALARLLQVDVGVVAVGDHQRRRANHGRSRGCRPSASTATAGNATEAVRAALRSEPRPRGRLARGRHVTCCS